MWLAQLTGKPGSHLRRALNHLVLGGFSGQAATPLFVGLPDRELRAISADTRQPIGRRAAAYREYRWRQRYQVSVPAWGRYQNLLSFIWRGARLDGHHPYYNHRRARMHQRGRAVPAPEMFLMGDVELLRHQAWPSGVRASTVFWRDVQRIRRSLLGGKRVEHATASRQRSARLHARGRFYQYNGFPQRRKSRSGEVLFRFVGFDHPRTISTRRSSAESWLDFIPFFHEKAMLRPFLNLIYHSGGRVKEQPNRGATRSASTAMWEPSRNRRFRWWDRMFRRRPIRAYQRTQDVLTEGEVQLWTATNRGRFFDSHFDPRYPETISQNLRSKYRPRSVAGFARYYHQFYGDVSYSPIPYRWWSEWFTIRRILRY